MIPVKSLGALIVLVSNVAGAEFPRPAAAMESQPFHSLLNPRSDIEIRSGCAQGGCPDHDKSFDFFTARDIIPGPTRGWIRVNYCGQCRQTHNKGANGACWGFSPGCEGPQNICVDPGNKRAHWIWKDTGAKKFFELVQETNEKCECGGGRRCDVHVWVPSEVDCTW